MYRLKYWIRDFFGFPRAHINGFILLLLLVIISLFSEPAWHWWVSSRAPDRFSDQMLLDSLVNEWEVPRSENQKDGPIPTFFSFDPNTVSSADLLSLGFSEQLSTRIMRYREKGGKFRIKKDLLKIYGIDSSFYQRLQAHIKLSDQHRYEKKPDNNLISKPIFAGSKEIQIFDINAADTAQLKKIKGIGEKLSMRIIKYRDALGGFVTTGQFREVYGLDSAVIGRLLKQTEVNPNYQPKKFNLNTASEKQLYAHPYFSKVARAIVSYRFQHGHFKSVEEIRNLGGLDEITMKKVTPYITVSDEP